MPVITQHLELAIRELQEGKPVAIPTETVYGLAAPINNEQAIKAVFAMKNRPLNHPLIVHVAKNFDLTPLVDGIPPDAHLLIQKFWPGPLTLVLGCEHKNLSPLITGGQTTVALRCPAHPLAQELLQQLKVPVVAPSANPFGKISPTTAQHVVESFPEQHLTVLDGGRCTVGIESTIVDVSTPQGYQILRHGLIDEGQIAAALAAPAVEQHSMIRVPGKLDSHYQPQKTLYYFADLPSLTQFCQQQQNVFVLASKKPESVSEAFFYPLAATPEQAAFDLYFQLRAADASSAQCIAIELPPATRAWQGVLERIVKAGVPFTA